MTKNVVLALACVLGSYPAVAQDPGRPEAADIANGPSSETPIPLKQVLTNVLHDQKPIFTFPWKAVRGEHWQPVLGVSLVTAGLVALDPRTERSFHDRAAFRSFKTGPLRGRNTTLAVTMTPVAFYLIGLRTHSTYARNTGLLAAQAVADTQILSFVMKQSIGRLKPSDIAPGGNLRDTWFKYKGSVSNGGGFPSGHTASAFGVATVIAERYGDHRWVPFAAYGTAAFLSLTRLPTQAHFPSDIFIGAALGYTVTHFVVMKSWRRSVRARTGP